MSKPLNLVIFERITCSDFGCDCGGDKTTWLNPMTGAEFDRTPDGRPNIERWDYDTGKRLTDAELAAEVWHSNFEFMVMPPGPERAEEASRGKILERFATHPHYDEQ